MKDQPRWRRYARLFGPDPCADMEDELRFHLDMRVQDYIRRGMSEADARAAAASRLGDLEPVRRECGVLGDASLRRHVWRQWSSELGQDMRYAARQLRRSPSFTLVAVLILAVGIGATTAIFSLVHAVLVAPLPYAQPDRLVQVWETTPQGDQRNVVSPGNFVDWRDQAQSFSVLGAYRNPYPVALTGDGQAEQVALVELQPAVVRALGVVPSAGRPLQEEDALGAGDVVVLSHALWRQQYGADQQVLGRRIVLNDRPHTVVGIMPPGFAFPHEGVEVWRPLREATIDPAERRSHSLHVIGRLAPDVSVEAAQAEMASLSARIAAEHPRFMTGWSVNVTPLHGDLTAHVRPLLAALLAGVTIVLLIACGNLATLLLARAVGRERELAVRGALGAGRARIARQLLTESTLLALLGGAGALLVAPLLLNALVAAAPADIPLLERAAIDGRMLWFVGTVALGCALLFGLAPVVRVARTDLLAALRGTRGTAPRGHVRWRGALVVSQVALSVVLLVGAGLFIRSFTALQATDLGFNEAGLVTMMIDLPRGRYADIPGQDALYARLLERAGSLPGVLAAAGTTEAPGRNYELTFGFLIEGRTARTASGYEDAEQLRAVTPGYFQVMDQQVLRGRPFDARDRTGAPPVAIVNESLARKHWPAGDAVGARIAFSDGASWLEIVGVVRDVRLASPDEEPVPALYVPHAQRAWPWMSWLCVVTRARPDVDERAVKTSLREAVLDLDAALPPQAVRTVVEAFRQKIARRSFALTLVTGFGVLAVLLSGVGLYGLLAYVVARQQGEIGVRLALGARPRDVAAGVLGRSLRLAVPGAALGTAGAVGATGLLDALLYGVSPLDAPTYAAAAVLVVTIAVATAGLPAWRAARIDPLDALRSD